MPIGGCSEAFIPAKNYLSTIQYPIYYFDNPLDYIIYIRTFPTQYVDSLQGCPDVSNNDIIDWLGNDYHMASTGNICFQICYVVRNQYYVVC